MCVCVFACVSVWLAGCVRKRIQFEQEEHADCRGGDRRSPRGVVVQQHPDDDGADDVREHLVDVDVDVEAVDDLSLRRLPRSLRLRPECVLRLCLL